MDEIEAFCAGRCLFAEQIFHLAADEFFAAGRMAEVYNQGIGQGGVCTVAVGQQPKGVGEQGIAGEQGGGFVELLVAGRGTTAQVAIVHTGQIVVNEAVGVQAFNRYSGGKRICPGGEELVAGQH